MLSRIIGVALVQGLQTSRGQPVVSENRPGGSGNIGAEAKAAVDAHTLFIGQIRTRGINPVLSAPTGTPAEVVAKISAEATLAVHIKSELAKWAPIVKASGAKVD